MAVFSWFAKVWRDKTMKVERRWSTYRNFGYCCLLMRWQVFQIGAVLRLALTRWWWGWVLDGLIDMNMDINKLRWDITAVESALHPASTTLDTRTSAGNGRLKHDLSPFYVHPGFYIQEEGRHYADRASVRRWMLRLYRHRSWRWSSNQIRYVMCTASDGDGNMRRKSLGWFTWAGHK